MQTHTPSACRYLNRLTVTTLIFQFLLCAAAFADSPANAGEGNEHWVATWSTALHQPDPGSANLQRFGSLGKYCSLALRFSRGVFALYR